MNTSLWELQVKHEKVDFECPTYNQVQDLCFDLFGEKNVIPDLERYLITIISPISLTITFDGCETKMYFHGYFDVNKEYLRSVTGSSESKFQFWRVQNSFRVFAYEEAKQYLCFKKQEAELIQKIEG